MNQNGSENDLGWKPKNDNEWESRMYANNTAQATDLSSGRRKSDFYDIPNPPKVYLVVEEHPQGIGHVGIVFEDDGGNTIGYHFGSWKTDDDKGNGIDGPGRMIVEKNAYHRVNEHGGTKFLLNMSPNEALRTKQFYTNLEKSGKIMERNGDLYDNILRKYELTGDFSHYNMGQIGGKNCVQNVLAGVSYGYEGNEQKRKAFQSLSLGTPGISPHVLSNSLRSRWGSWSGVIKDYSVHGNADYEKMMEVGLP